MEAVSAAGGASAGASHRPVLALDIGGTKLAAGVVGSGRVHSFVVESTLADQGPERGLARLFELGRRAVADSGL
ncbi:MAG: ROK family protein, partial [Actinobacteria bacterium]|nr:ROK family protein [Actinomycetota bacterium]